MKAKKKRASPVKKSKVKKVRWKGVRKKTIKRKLNEKKGKVTYYRLFGKAEKKHTDKVYAASVTLINPSRGKYALEKWADLIDAMDKIKGLDRLIDPMKGRGKPKKATIIVVQRNRVKPHRFEWTNYPSGEAMKITERNVKSHVVGVLRGHEENIRQSIIRRGYRDKKYDEGTFKAWHVPYIDINFHYQIRKLK